jgi:hypothetical protein
VVWHSTSGSVREAYSCPSLALIRAAVVWVRPSTNGKMLKKITHWNTWSLVQVSSISFAGCRFAFQTKREGPSMLVLKACLHSTVINSYLFQVMAYSI